MTRVAAALLLLVLTTACAASSASPGGPGDGGPGPADGAPDRVSTDHGADGAQADGAPDRVSTEDRAGGARQADGASIEDDGTARPSSGGGAAVRPLLLAGADGPVTVEVSEALADAHADANRRITSAVEELAPDATFEDHRESLETCADGGHRVVQQARVRFADPSAAQAFVEALAAHWADAAPEVLDDQGAHRLIADGTTFEVVPVVDTALVLLGFTTPCR